MSDRFAEIEAAANLIAERLAASPPAVAESVLGDDWWQPQEPVDVVRDALLAEVGPMSFTGKAFFILDALEASGWCVTKSPEGAGRFRSPSPGLPAPSGPTSRDGAA